MLREKARKRKEEKAKQQEEQLWDQVSEGENVDSEEEEMEQKKVNKGDLFRMDSDDEDDDLLVPVTTKRDHTEELPAVSTNPKQLKKKMKKITSEGIFGGKNR